MSVSFDQPSFDEFDGDKEYLINLHDNNDSKDDLILIHKLIVDRFNSNIITYNANINSFKNIALYTEKEFKSIVITFINIYFDIYKLLIEIIKNDEDNKVLRNYNEIIIPILTAIDWYMLKLHAHIKQIIKYLANVEKILRIHGWCIVRGIWLFHHMSNFGPLQELKEEDNDIGESNFIQSIIDCQAFIHYNVYEKIRKNLENIYWFYKYPTSNAYNNETDLLKIFKQLI